MSRKSSPNLLLTQRALRDIQSIFEYSVERQGGGRLLKSILMKWKQGCCGWQIILTC